MNNISNFWRLLEQKQKGFVILFHYVNLIEVPEDRESAIVRFFLSKGEAELYARDLVERDYYRRSELQISEISLTELFKIKPELTAMASDSCGLPLEVLLTCIVGSDIILEDPLTAGTQLIN